jgi:hypothetical protein
MASSLKLVGDRHDLTARQRLAVSRSACSDQALSVRRLHRVGPQDLCNTELWIDGYNVLTSVEAALGKGVILLGRDGCFRDMASMHGSYRRVDETVPAIERIGRQLSEWRVAHCRWLLDRPVSNSGRLKQLLLESSQRHAWNWEVDLVADPDPVLSQCDQLIASADSQILDQAGRWVNLAREVIEARIADAWILNLSDLSPES